MNIDTVLRFEQIFLGLRPEYDILRLIFGVIRLSDQVLPASDLSTAVAVIQSTAGGGVERLAGDWLAASGDGWGAVAASARVSGGTGVSWLASVVASSTEGSEATSVASAAVTSPGTGVGPASAASGVGVTASPAGSLEASGKATRRELAPEGSFSTIETKTILPWLLSTILTQTTWVSLT